jgi:hypothetical protein
LGDNLSPTLTRFRTNIKNPVRLGSDCHVVLDDHHRVSFIDETVQDIDEALNILQVKSDGGFLNEVEVALFKSRVV